MITSLRGSDFCSAVQLSVVLSILRNFLNMYTINMEMYLYKIICMKSSRPHVLCIEYVIDSDLNKYLAAHFSKLQYSNTLSVSSSVSSYQS